MLNILLITIGFVIVSDILQFWNNFSPIISGWLTGGKIKKAIPSKIMTCSTCQSWWTGLLYIILTHQLTIPMVVYTLFVASMAPVISDFLRFITETLKTVLYKINNKLN
jgi:hypothetical protein